MFRLKILKLFRQSNVRTHILLSNNIKVETFPRFCSVHYSKHVLNLSENEFTSNNNARKGFNVNAEKNNRRVLSEKEFLVRLKDNPDSFGSDNNEGLIDNGDLEEERHYTEQPLPAQKLSTKKYADIIKGLIRQRKIKEAIDFVEIRMIKEDRVKPENYIYNILLGACGRVGYTKKAFSLFNDMKKRGLRVTGGTYTALFNACSNSPWKEDCLTRATHLRNIMIEKMFEPNITNYNVMIKAFGRGGDLATAFNLVDEMISKGINIKSDTINFLLQACITDKDAGFRHALLVWQKLIVRNIEPSVYTYNLLLRCIRDCGLGDIEVFQDVIKKIVGNNVFIPLIETEIPKQKSYVDTLKNYEDSLVDGNKSEKENVNESLCVTTNKENCSKNVESTLVNEKVKFDLLEDSMHPNLMADQPTLGNIISLSEVKKPEDRLLLVGGLTGFLSSMTQHNCTPDIKTFTQLLDTIPNTVALENKLISAIENAKIKPDLDFYNMLIKKRSMRFDYEGGKEVLRLMKKSHYKPDLVTYGVLALGCRTREEALELLDEMSQKKYRLNAEILGAMLNQAAHHLNFPYVLEIMEIMVREQIRPNKKFMECLEQFRKRTKQISNDKRNKLYHSEKFRKSHEQFRLRYKTWYQKIEIDDSDSQHPWQQFRQPTKTEKYEDKEVRFKPVHKSLFRVKTSLKHMEKK